MQEYPDFSESGRSASVTPFVFGALLGAGIALLLAPAHGRDTRRRVGSTVKSWGEGAGRVIRGTREKLNDIKKDAKSAIESGRQEYMRSRRPEDQPGARTVHSPAI